MAEQETTAPKTIIKRGVASARGTQRLKFTHEDANKQTGLFIAHLESVEVSMIKIGEDKQGMPSFNGLEIPKLRFLFTSNEENPAKRKYAVLQFNAVESNKDTIPGGKDEWKVNQVFDWINHILKVYVCKGKELTEVFNEDTLNSLNLSFTDFDENGNYEPVAPETVIAAWKAVFDNVENILNRGNKDSSYYMKDGKFIPVWIKLLRCTKSKNKGWVNVSNGDLTFPTFIGEGCIEFIVPNTRPSIHLDMIKESIIPKVVDTPKQPTQLNNPAMTGGLGMGGFIADSGAPMNSGIGIGNEMPSDIQEDMPAEMFEQ
mgnify:CR=1 FL=1